MVRGGPDIPVLTGVQAGKSPLSCGMQVTLCDHIRHVISRSGVVVSITNCYILLPFYFVTFVTIKASAVIVYLNGMESCGPDEMEIDCEKCERQTRHNRCSATSSTDSDGMQRSADCYVAFHSHRYYQPYRVLTAL